MPHCAGVKPDTAPCERIVKAPQSYCYAHDPDRADERSRNASHAASSKPNREVADLKGWLRAITRGVIAEKIDPRRAAVAVQALNALARVLELERRIKETDELAERLAELEAIASGANGSVRR